MKIGVLSILMIFYCRSSESSITLKWYVKYPIEGKRFHFSCILTYAAKAPFSVCFHRADKHRWCVDQHLGNCTPSTAAADDYDDNYQVICGNGTDKLDAPLKIYSLQISQVSASDKRLWWCQIENTSSLSNTYRMEPRICSLSLRDSGKTAMLYKSYYFVCTVMNAANMDDELQFLRQQAMVASIYQKDERCVVFGEPISDTYQIRCGNGTNEMGFDIKTYLLQVTHVLLEDIEEWWCQLRRLNIHSEPLNLHLKPMSLELRGLPHEPQMGTMFTLTCTVKFAVIINDKLQFFRNLELAASLSQKSSFCSVADLPISKTYEAKCLAGTDNTKTSIKDYGLIIHGLAKEDTTEWWCEFATDGARSQTFNLVTKTAPKTERFSLSGGDISAIVICMLVTVVLVASWVIYQRRNETKMKSAKHVDKSSEHSEDTKSILGHETGHDEHQSEGGSNKAYSEVTKQSGYPVYLDVGANDEGHTGHKKEGGYNKVYSNFNKESGFPVYLDEGEYNKEGYTGLSKEGGYNKVYSNFNKQSGYTGLKSESGYSKDEGYTGLKSESGYSKDEGYTGLKSEGGYDKDEGYTGHKSESGYGKDKGYTGLKSESGYSKDEGYTGLKSEGGYDKDEGYTGHKSESGYGKDKGYTGLKSESGYSKDEGYTGLKSEGGYDKDEGYTGHKSEGGYSKDEGYTGHKSEGGYGKDKGYTGHKSESGYGKAEGHTGHKKHSKSNTENQNVYDKMQTKDPGTEYENIAENVEDKPEYSTYEQLTDVDDPILEA